MPDFFHVIMEDQDWCISIQIPNLHHESSADCERGRKVFLLKRGGCVAFVFVSFVIIVQRKVKSLLQGGAEWNWAVLFLMFRISGVTPHLGLGGFSIWIPTKIVIPHMGEIIIMWLFFWPSLTRDSVNNSGVIFSIIVTAWSWLQLFNYEKLSTNIHTITNKVLQYCR